MKPRPGFLRGVVPAALIGLGCLLGACNAILGIDGAESGYSTGGQGGAGTGTSHTGSGASTSSSGGSGGCTVASDCPGTDDDCSHRTCNEGSCLIVFEKRGTPILEAGRRRLPEGRLRRPGLGRQTD